jgi:hypothetical protein
LPKSDSLFFCCCAYAAVLLLHLQARLSPIAAAFSMDPVERALRVGGEREVAKKSEEEAGTIAGEQICIVGALCEHRELSCEVQINWQLHHFVADPLHMFEGGRAARSRSSEQALGTLP